MAAVAVAGAASAQVSITGAVGFGYAKDADAKGYKVTDGNVTFSATEDLGGGLAVNASTKLDSMTGRQSENPTMADATVTVSAGGAFVTMGSFESTADARKGDVSGLSLEQGLDKAEYNLGSGNVDGIAASFSLMDGLSVGLAHTEGANTSGTALGDVTAAIKATKISAAYTAGPLMVFASQINYTGGI